MKEPNIPKVLDGRELGLLSRAETVAVQFATPGTQLLNTKATVDSRRRTVALRLRGGKKVLTFICTFGPVIVSKLAVPGTERHEVEASVKIIGLDKATSKIALDARLISHNTSNGNPAVSFRNYDLFQDTVTKVRKVWS